MFQGEKKDMYMCVHVHNTQKEQVGMRTEGGKIFIVGEI